MPGPRNPSAWPLRNRRLRGRLAATAHAAGKRALAVRGARRQLRNSRGTGDPLARFASRTRVRQVPEGTLPPCLRHVLTIRNVFASPIGLARATGRRTTDSGLSSARAATKRAETKPAPAECGTRDHGLNDYAAEGQIRRFPRKGSPCEDMEQEPSMSSTPRFGPPASGRQCAGGGMPLEPIQAGRASHPAEGRQSAPVPSTTSRSAGNEKMPG